MSFIIRYKKGRRRHDYDVYKKNHPVTPKEVVNVFDLGYLGLATGFPEQMSSIPIRKKRDNNIYHSKKENATKVIP